MLLSPCVVTLPNARNPSFDFSPDVTATSGMLMTPRQLTIMSEIFDQGVYLSPC